jgi:cell division protease FtsH
MPVETWLPVGFSFPDGARTRLAIQSGENWQIVETVAQGRALVVKPSLAHKWADAGLIEWGSWQTFQFGADSLFVLTSSSQQWLAAVNDCRSPGTKSEALAFAASMRETRAIDATSPLQDAIYVERLSRLLPTFSLATPVPDDIVLGAWLAGGAQVSVHSTRRINSLLSWLGSANLSDVIRQAGLTQTAAQGPDAETPGSEPAVFKLAGRPALEQFFREHVIDIIANAARYRALGIDFPTAIILHGPPGCGKTFAVDRLVEFLGWPSFSIDATSIGSPYIHETSRKVAEVFDKAMKEAPSVLIIDEMEAFLADREMGAGSSHHRVEEVGEFLRRIPEAIKSHVLVIGMTNRFEMIDSAIQRRGRFDHVVLVDMPSREEVDGLLKVLYAKLPIEAVDLDPISTALAGRPLSDVDFVVRESARLAAKAGRESIDQNSILLALNGAPPRGPAPARKIGFL